jgi:hypothetical protein
LDLSYPSGPPEQGVVKIFDTNVVILPAFLDQDVRVQAKILSQSADEKEQELVIFDSDHMKEAWFIRGGISVEFSMTTHRPSNSDAEIKEQPDSIALMEGERQGTAAVFVVGPLCTEYHQTEEQENAEAEDEEGEEDEGEKGESNAVAVDEAVEAR